MHPSIAINSISYRGYFESDDIFDAICSSFTKMPQVCKDPLSEKLKNALRPNFNDLDQAAKVRKFVVWTVLGVLLAL